MKGILVFLLSIFVSVSLLAQESKSCCSTEQKSSKASFTAFADDQSFRDTHQLPADFKLQNAKGIMITFPTEDGKNANAYFIKSEKKSNKFILVVHEWWGLNDNIKRESDELSQKLGDVNIIALDLYDGKVATTRDAAAQFMQSSDPKRIENIFKGAVKFAGKDAEFGMIGWCFGGGWSLQMSIWLREKGKACVMYYGIIQNDADTFKELNAPVLGIFARKDGWVNPEVYGNLEKNLIIAGKKIIIKEYDADHAFANPSNQYFDENAAKDAKNHVIRFFKENLMK